MLDFGDVKRERFNFYSNVDNLLWVVGQLNLLTGTLKVSMIKLDKR